MDRYPPWVFRWHLFAASFVLAPAFVGAEGLTVLVRDADGEPAALASVRAESLAGEIRVLARAGTDGRASLGELPDGRYLVSAQSGDLSAEPVEIEVRDGAAPAVGLTLRFAAVRETVVVSAALAARSEREAGTPVDVLAAAALESRDEWSLVEGLRGVPGILIRQDGGPGHLATLQIRGLPGSATAVVVDGAPLRDPAAVQGDSATLLPSLGTVGVERVEIRRGGGSTLYGTNGMGGVLHIVTRSESSPETLRLAAGLGSAGHSAVAGAWGVSGPDGGVSLGIGRVGVTTGADGADPFANLSGVARAGFRVGGSGVRVSLRAFASDASVGLNEDAIPLGAPGPGIVEASPVTEAVVRRYEEGTPLASLEAGAANFLPSTNDPDARQETRFLSVLARIGQTAGNRSWSVRFHQLETRRSNEDGPAGPGVFDPPELQTTTWDGGDIERRRAPRGPLREPPPARRWRGRARARGHRRPGVHHRPPADERGGVPPGRDAHHRGSGFTPRFAPGAGLPDRGPRTRTRRGEPVERGAASARRRRDHGGGVGVRRGQRRAAAARFGRPRVSGALALRAVRRLLLPLRLFGVR